MEGPGRWLKKQNGKLLIKWSGEEGSFGGFGTNITARNFVQAIRYAYQIGPGATILRFLRKNGKRVMQEFRVPYKGEYDDSSF
ncbi:hypothetical protein C4577_02965 [Candidatus Parcubacteria bacterium]|nr:MAG: hypothetical protein C4577_02965 [Candidatus Parcubacteria bacterium]